MICRAGARGLSAPLTRELNCTHRWPQHLSFAGIRSLGFTSATQFAQRETADDEALKDGYRWMGPGPVWAGGTEFPCCGWVAYDAWESSRNSKEFCMSVRAQGEARSDPVHHPRWKPLTSSSGLTKLNKLLIGSIMMSPKVRVQVCVPAAGQAATSCQQQVTWPANVPLCKQSHERTGGTSDISKIKFVLTYRRKLHTEAEWKSLVATVEPRFLHRGDYVFTRVYLLFGWFVSRIAQKPLNGFGWSVCVSVQKKKEAGIFFFNIERWGIFGELCSFLRE